MVQKWRGESLGGSIAGPEIAARIIKQLRPRAAEGCVAMGDDASGAERNRGEVATVCAPDGGTSDAPRVQSPHDALFKQVFGVPENAAGELRSVLPEAVAARIDWTTLARVDGSFVDADLSTSESDLVFSVRIGARRALVYILFEHQSSSDPMMGLRLLRYIVRIWERWMHGDASAARLPLVLPVVLHHSETGWTAARRFSDLVDLSDDERAAFGSLVPDFEYVLDDVSHASDDDLMGRGMSSAAALVLWALRDARRLDAPGFEKAVKRWRNRLATLTDQPGGVEVLQSLFCYYSAVGEVSPERVGRALRDHVGRRAEEAYVTTADMLRQEGRALGRAEGRTEGKAEGKAEGEARAICAVLEARGLAVSDAIRQRIASCRDLATLDRWLVRAATAAAAEEVFAGD
jgi:predicted transposase/invertase (TIGR01784 family)